MHGAGADDLVIRVPTGTVIRDDESGEVLADLVEDGQEAVVARGGRGGRGNARFSSAVNRAPSLSENGEPGQERWIRLELKLLADVGLVGFPNAGKSTLIARVSAARPKIADYPFTTLVPNLGVVTLKGREPFVVADIPGLIEGAHSGSGLGHEFLRHIERTRVLVFVLDAAETEERGVLDDYHTLREELERFNSLLLDRPYLIAANKMDLPRARENQPRLQAEFADRLYNISAVTGEGVEALLEAVQQLLIKTPRDVVVEEEALVVRRFEPEEEPFHIEVEDGIYQVSGKRIEKLVHMTNFSTEEGLRRFQRTIIKMGLENALKALGIQPGDTVKILDLELEYNE